MILRYDVVVIAKTMESMCIFIATWKLSAVMILLKTRRALCVPWLVCMFAFSMKWHMNGHNQKFNLQEPRKKLQRSHAASVYSRWIACTALATWISGHTPHTNTCPRTLPSTRLRAMFDGCFIFWPKSKSLKLIKMFRVPYPRKTSIPLPHNSFPSINIKPC